jgi:hypothetical protein
MTDTTELVARLRLRIRQDEGDASFLTAIPPKFLYREAADAIERLTRERDEARAAALEEAAKVFDDVAIGHRRVADMHNRFGYARGMELALLAAKAAEDAAYAIRALKEPT